MTNRDPNQTEFVRLFGDYYNCMANYFKISDSDKLKKDLDKPDIDLVCNHELYQIKKHLRSNGWGLHQNDFLKMMPREENDLVSRLREAQQARK